MLYNTQKIGSLTIPLKKTVPVTGTGASGTKPKTPGPEIPFFSNG